MAIKQDFSSSWLKNNLLADYWKPREAFVILAGLSWKDDGGPDDEGFDYLGSVERDGGPDYWNGVREREDIANRLEYYWASQSDDPKPPAFFIEWAISKSQPPEWLDWAIEHDLYTPKHGTEEAVPSSSVDNPGRRDQQYEIILAVIAALEFEALQIPDGGKSKIKKICLTRPRMFTSDGFDHAWKAGVSDGRFKLANHVKYSQNK
jgi:hypothetical protein